MTTTAAYTLTLEAEGRVEVPGDVRAELGVQEGDDLILLRDDQGYRLTSRRALALELKGSLKNPLGIDLTQELLDERRAEAARKGW